jgi:nicotinic acid phosphoribosyltransferase
MPSVLATDGYKLSMAEAGFALRTETFYYSHRKGGVQKVPFDGAAMVRALLPEATEDDYRYLQACEYEMGAAFKAAILRRDKLKIASVPKGAWVLPREPILSVTGPSALVSWLEPLVLQLSYRVQIATVALEDKELLPKTVTCEEQRAIVQETLEAIGVVAPPIAVDPDAYRARVAKRALELASAAGARVFEVGLRAASCIDQHMIALEGCKEGGITRTSHVLGAKRLGMIPVGTMGHEHIMRYGDDEAAFRAMRDRRPGRSSYLLDTFDTLRSGLPAAYAIISEDPAARDSIRYDSGDKTQQYKHAVALAQKYGIRPVHILEDGFDLEQTIYFEQLRNELGVASDDQFYGFGGYLVSDGKLTRDRVSAVYKLTQTGRKPTMKFANESGEGKRSVPGRPIIFRRVRGDGAGGIIGQEGEPVPEGYALLTGAERDLGRPEQTRVELSEATRALVADLEKERTLRLGELQ